MKHTLRKIILGCLLCGIFLAQTNLTLATSTSQSNAHLIVRRGLYAVHIYIKNDGAEVYPGTSVNYSITHSGILSTSFVHTKISSIQPSTREWVATIHLRGIGRAHVYINTQDPQVYPQEVVVFVIGNLLIPMSDCWWEPGQK